jgi:O-antigen/teichoic acid export membrane protein
MTVEKNDTSLPGLGGSVWSVTDQAVVSLGTFLTSIALARHLRPSDYGAYGALLAALLFLNGVHTSLVTSPLSVRGAAVDRATLGRYSTVSVLFTLALAVPSGLLLLAASAGVGGSSLWIWAPASLVLWQVQETMRRSLMCGLGHRRAVWGAASSRFVRMGNG